MNFQYSSQDEQTAVGGKRIVKQIAVNPLDDHFYLLGEDSTVSTPAIQQLY